VALADPSQDRDQQFTILSPSGLDGEHARRLLHHLDAVEHQVHQDLLKLDTIRRDPGKVRLEIGAYPDGLPGGLFSATQESDGAWITRRPRVVGLERPENDYPPPG
jgi:hypothetical protein